MGKVTGISWCDHTFNAWIGCTKVAPACDGCYAEFLMDLRFGRVEWGPHGERVRTSAANWKEPLKWNRAAVRDGVRRTVFCCSLADVFDNKVPAQWRRDLFDLIRATPQLVWLLLTKRPQNITWMAAEAGGLPENVALGTTIEDQQRADMNLPPLLQATALLKPILAFVSCEPLLVEIDLTRIKVPDHAAGMYAGHGHTFNALQREDDLTLFNAPAHLGWVITGGETDQGKHMARPSHPRNFRVLRNQCRDAEVPFHHKQNGEWVSVSEVAGPGEHFTFPDGATVRKIGKSRSGRTIDGVEHNELPRWAA